MPRSSCEALRVPTRLLAAQIRYEHYQRGRDAVDIAHEFETAVSTVRRVLSGQLYSPKETRVVVEPSYTPRRGHLAPEVRRHVAHLICHGAPLRALERHYKVAIGTIQAIKANYTVRTSVQSYVKKKRKKAAFDGPLDACTAAEVRYRVRVLGKSTAEVAAETLIPYNDLWKVLEYEDFPVTDGRELNRRMPHAHDTPEAHVVYLYLYGAELDFCAAVAGVDEDRAAALIKKWVTVPEDEA